MNIARFSLKPQELLRNSRDFMKAWLTDMTDYLKKIKSYWERQIQACLISHLKRSSRRKSERYRELLPWL